MKIAILGGGITGLTAAYKLAQKGHKVTVFEKEKILGGLASGFKADGWDWYLERAYHHLFASDSDILKFAQEIGFDKIFFQAPITSSLFEKDKKINIHALDTPIDLLKFPYLNIIDKLRAGFIIVFLKLSPYLPLYNSMTSEDFLKKTMGKNVWNVLWRQLFRGKFGDYAGIILSVFIWARINKRTKNLGYVKGGFQELVSYLEKLLKSIGVKVLKGYQVEEIKARGEKILVNGEVFDRVISTLPTPVLVKLTENIFTDNYLSKFKKLRYLHAVTMIMETEKPILNKTYWLNICTEKIPFMILAQHTNFIDKKNYGGKHISYLGWYVDVNSKLLKMTDNEIIKMVTPALEKIENFKLKIINYFIFRVPWAQPIFDKDFVKNMPTFKTPNKNFFIANLDMTYPYDRGTNYAVKLGIDVSKFIQ